MILAHQGGWDEILLVGTPVALFALLLYVANMRAERRVAQMEGAEDAPGDATDSSDATASGGTPGTGEHPPGVDQPASDQPSGNGHGVDPPGGNGRGGHGD